MYATWIKSNTNVTINPIIIVIVGTQFQQVQNYM